MSALSASLAPSWKTVLQGEFEQPYMRSLQEFLILEHQRGKVVFPRDELVFNALNTTPLQNVKVVILGQDPYHGPGQAHGLSFSVLPGVRTPPSLKNIFKEISRDLHLPIPAHGCLQAWAEQGVLLLNATLTVEQGNAGSHQRKGWETFTDAIIAAINERLNGVVFMLWGSYAQKKGKIINSTRHCVLTSPHPSPLSAHRGFLGNGHFSAANDYLQKNGRVPVNWSLPSPL